MNLADMVKNEVIEGPNQYLFAVGDPIYLNIIAGRQPVHPLTLANFAENMVARPEKAKAWNVAWAHIVMPDKPSTLPHEFPAPVTPVGAQFVAACSPNDRLIYPLETMRAGRAEPILRDGKADTAFYNRVGSHPEHAAYVHFARELARATGLDLPDAIWRELLDARRIFASLSDLGMHASVPQPQDIEETAPSWPVIAFDNGLSRMWDGAMALYLNPKAPMKRRLLVLGDSCMAELALVCSALFDETLFGRTLFFHDELIQGVRPDVVWTGHSDRYSWFCNDRERPLFLTMAGRCGAPQPNDRQTFWTLVDALMMTDFEAHRFPHAVSQAIGRDWKAAR